MRRQHAQMGSLTAREREVLALIGRGLSMPEIARSLHRSRKTIESHRLALGRKLQASNRVELARIAITAGLAPLGEATRRDERQLDELRRDLTGHTAAWNAMCELDAGLASDTGHRYLRKLLTRLCHALGARGALLSELTAQSHPPCRDMLVCESGQAIDQWEGVALADSPCEQVIRNGSLRLDGDVRERFPGNPLLERLEARSFIGIRLNGAHQAPIGVLALIHNAPFDDRAQPETLLRICASRAAAELERARMDEQLLEANEQLERRVHQRTEQLQQANRRLKHQLDQLRRTQQQLEQSEQRFRTLVETMNEGVAVMDAHGTINYVNQRFAQILATTPEELIGTSPTEFIADASSAAWFSGLELERRRGTLRPYHLRVRRRDGTTCLTHVSPKSLYDDQGDYIGSFGVVSEVPEQPEGERTGPK